MTKYRFRITQCVGLLVSVALIGGGCGTKYVDGDTEPGEIVFGTDVPWKQDTQPLQDGSDPGDGVWELADGMVGDGAADLPGDLTIDAGDIMDVASDAGKDVVPDLLPPKDVVETTVPDVVKDQVEPDLNPCGCPAETPLCVDGVCQCNATSCPAGNYCKAGVCAACTVDSKCGPECKSCASEGGYCSVEGDRCVYCDSGHLCPQFFMCVEDECVSCEGMGLCGPNCLACDEKTPVCHEGKCICSISSCGAGYQCVNGSCLACSANDPNRCGPSCTVCGGTTPHCKGGVCTVCNTDSSCGPTCAPCGGTTPICRPDGFGCVACLFDTDCAANHYCDGGQCIPNCAAQGCTGQVTDAKKCSSAIIVGRLEAKLSKKYSGDMYGDGNNDDVPSSLMPDSICWDAEADNFYRIYLIKNDVLTVLLTPKDSEFNAMMKLYSGTDCDGGSNDHDDIINCFNAKSTGQPESFSYTATADGWYTVVVDGRTSGDYGLYDITFTLACSQTNCCCQ